MAGGVGAVGGVLHDAAILSVLSGATLALAAQLALGRAPLDAVALTAPAPAIVVLLGREFVLPPSLVPLLAVAAEFAVLTVAVPLERRAAAVVVALHALLGGLLWVVLGSVAPIP